MLGLIKKDLLMIKGTIKFIGIITVVYAIMAIIEGDINGVAFIPALVCIMMMTTFSYDEFNKTDAYVTTFPCGKKNVVKAKYITTLILFIASTLISIILSFIIGVLNGNFDFQYCLENVLGVAIAVSIIQCLFYPVIYKFGIEKSRIGIFVFVFAVVGIITLLYKSGINMSVPKNIASIFDNYWFIIIPLITTILWYVSFRISTRIYMKKEF